jgi:hypothetical protein
LPDIWTLSRFTAKPDLSASGDLEASVCPEIGNWLLIIRYCLPDCVIQAGLPDCVIQAGLPDCVITARMRSFGQAGGDICLLNFQYRTSNVE